MQQPKAASARSFGSGPHLHRSTAGHFEVVSLSGYLAENEFHLHMAVSDGDGRTIGGHVMEGNIVFTTLVVAIHEHLRHRYRRQYDPTSKYDELVIEKR